MTDSEFQKAVLERFEAMDARFDALEGKVDQGFARGRTVRRPPLFGASQRGSRSSAERSGRGRPNRRVG